MHNPRVDRTASSDDCHSSWEERNTRHVEPWMSPRFDGIGTVANKEECALPYHWHSIFVFTDEPYCLTCPLPCSLRNAADDTLVVLVACASNQNHGSYPWHMSWVLQQKSIVRSLICSALTSFFHLFPNSEPPSPSPISLSKISKIVVPEPILGWTAEQRLTA